MDAVTIAVVVGCRCLLSFSLVRQCWSLSLSLLVSVCVSYELVSLWSCKDIYELSFRNYWGYDVFVINVGLSLSLSRCRFVFFVVL